MSMISAQSLVAGYPGRPVLHDVNITVSAGEHVSLVGPSGSGKSTLLYCLGGLLVPERGEIRFRDTVLNKLGQAARAQLRLRHFGFVFQSSELLPELSLSDNVQVPLRLLGWSASKASRVTMDLLDRLGIASVADRRPVEVSGGEEQRAALARALVHGPSVIFADEPTGALDSENADLVLTLLEREVRLSSAALVLITHDGSVASRADRVIRMVDGRTPSAAPS